MGRRLHSLFTEAWHLVLLVAAAGLCVAGIAALIAFAAGKRGGHEVITVVIAVGVIGVVTVFVGTFIDPMSSLTLLTGSRHSWQSVAKQSELLREEEHGLPPEVAAEFRRDDLLYAGGVLLIGFAVLLAYACTWAGVPPANPLHS